MIITLEIFTLNVSLRSAEICQGYYRDCNTRCLAVWIIRHVNLYIFERFMSLVCCCTSWITSLRISSYILKVLFTNKWYTHTQVHTAGKLSSVVTSCDDHCVLCPGPLSHWHLYAFKHNRCVSQNLSRTCLGHISPQNKLWFA